MIKLIVKKVLANLGYQISQISCTSKCEGFEIENESLDALQTLLLPIDRFELLRYLPHKGTVAEIGVATGGFSSAIWHITVPQKLHLIDPWLFQSRCDYKDDPINQANKIQEERFLSVKKQFEKPISQQRVQVHREFSTIAADKFSDSYFDWIYIDALHSYEAVKHDLEAFAPRIKNDGLILGHDFAQHSEAMMMNFGVITAVKDFISERGYYLLALTNEPYPTYVICKTKDSPVVQKFISLLLNNVEGIVELNTNDILSSGIKHKYITSETGKKKLILTFS